MAKKRWLRLNYNRNGKQLTIYQNRDGSCDLCDNGKQIRWFLTLDECLLYINTSM